MKTLTLYKVYYSINQFLICNQKDKGPGSFGGQNNRIFSQRIYMKITKIEFSSQRREILLFLTTNIAGHDVTFKPAIRQLIKLVQSIDKIQSSEIQSSRRHPKPMVKTLVIMLGWSYQSPKYDALLLVFLFLFLTNSCIWFWKKLSNQAFENAVGMS